MDRKAANAVARELIEKDVQAEPESTNRIGQSIAISLSVIADMLTKMADQMEVPTPEDVPDGVPEDFS